MAQCSVDECEGKAKAKGFCVRHYTRWRRYGDPSVVKRGPLAPALQLDAKQCNACGETKPIEQFGPDKRNRDGRKGRCHPCEQKHQYEWRTSHPDRWQEIRQDAANRRAKDRWKYRIKETYNITFEEYERLLAAQGGVCAICGGSRNGPGRRFHIDHDHTCCPGVGSCGRCIRGLLCGRCNTMVGLAKDDPERLLAAVRYLRKER
ncbi:hypothetical protein FHR32_005122 [Streptosporangium album]|uniref:Recombination endonuclease VII n=1 Tax=Streptosporangium album TaxID=47479 RepID=A0A7W7RZ14_9ACTN|nr:endonuclease VII domain-containing protein [Streptosporangium album]MBB4940745.1 hypothetical protein [Streptosporangium album]